MGIKFGSWVPNCHCKINLVVMKADILPNRQIFWLYGMPIVHMTCNPKGTLTMQYCNAGVNAGLLTWKVHKLPCVAVPQLEYYGLWCWFAQCHIHSHILSHDDWWAFKEEYLNGKQGYCVGVYNWRRALWALIAIPNMNLWSNLQVDQQCSSSIQGIDDWHTAWNEVYLNRQNFGGSHLIMW